MNNKDLIYRSGTLQSSSDSKFALTLGFSNVIAQEVMEENSKM